MPVAGVDNSGNAFGFALVKITLIILNALVLMGLVFVIVVVISDVNSTLVVFLSIIGLNFLAAVIGTAREHRLTVLTTGSVTLIMLLLMLFTREERRQTNMYSFMYFLAIVILSFAYSAMLRQRQIQRLRETPAGLPAASRLATVVVYHPPNTMQTHLSTGVSSLQNNNYEMDGESGVFKDPPPAYMADIYPPPPKYEEVCDTQPQQPK